MAAASQRVNAAPMMVSEGSFAILCYGIVALA